MFFRVHQLHRASCGRIFCGFAVIMSKNEQFDVPGRADIIAVIGATKDVNIMIHSVRTITRSLVIGG